MRKLASVVRVTDVTPIANADRIALAKVAGWRCVIKKGELQPGDLAVYFELDAVPPDSARFAWLWQKPGAPAAPRPASFRIRTLQLRGTLSQGLLMPLPALGLVDVAEGDDVTQRLGVTKYEPPPPSGMGDYRGPFPSLVSKTDELRVQSMPALLDELKGQPYVATVKMDGTSATFAMVDGAFHACGRNHSILEGENVYWYVARKYRLPERLPTMPAYVFQGEVAGPGVQKNPAGLSDKTLLIFRVFDVAASQPLSDPAMRALCAELGLPVVPIAFEGPSFDESVDSLLAKAEGLYEGTAHQREGVVVRPLTPRRTDVLGSWLSFKAISNRYLLDERD